MQESLGTLETNSKITIFQFFSQPIQAAVKQLIHYYAFEMLYWCGLRVGELFALTPDDFNFEASTVTINKSYQRIGHDDVVTDALFVVDHNRIHSIHLVYDSFTSDQKKLLTLLWFGICFMQLAVLPRGYSVFLLECPVKGGVIRKAHLLTNGFQQYPF